MVINEVFPNPTVKQVIFQIRFPNLLFLESKMGDYQQRIMGQFPESEVVYRQQVVFVDIGPEARIEEFPKPEARKRIWKFVSPDEVVLNLSTDSLDISSKSHKTYSNPCGKLRFRDTIRFAVDAFLAVAPVPVIRRIGLRYIDECPVPKRTKEEFTSYYNTSFPIDRFSLEDALEMQFKACVKRSGSFLRYIESLQTRDGTDMLVLDFDGFAENIKATEYLDVTDALHRLISEEYQRIIKEPVYEYMRRAPDAKGGTVDGNTRVATA
jgi:uncharacterized protein (TIGR04255 family)